MQRRLKEQQQEQTKGQAMVGEQSNISPAGLLVVMQNKSNKSMAKVWFPYRVSVISTPVSQIF